MIDINLDLNYTLCNTALRQKESDIETLQQLLDMHETAVEKQGELIAKAKIAVPEALSDLLSQMKQAKSESMQNRHGDSGDLADEAASVRLTQLKALGTSAVSLTRSRNPKDGIVRERSDKKFVDQMNPFAATNAATDKRSSRRNQHPAPATQSKQHSKQLDSDIEQASTQQSQAPKSTAAPGRTRPPLPNQHTSHHIS
jgi:hypothetical protein